MLSRKLFFLAFISCVIFYAGCNRSIVQLESTTASGEVPQLGNLVFKFSNSLYPDSLLNTWDSSDYISFKPAIPGRFKWNGPAELVFSPSEPLLPATNYTAKINDEVLRFSSFNSVKEGNDIKFHTPRLALNDAHVSWVLQDESSRTAIPQVNLVFNYPVNADEVKSKIFLEVEGKQTDFQLQNVGYTNELIIKLPSFKAEDRSYQASLKIDKGIKPEKSNSSSEEEINTTLSISSPYVLNINSVEAEHDGTQGLVHVYTSQQLTQENISTYLKFDPKVNYTTEFRDNGITIRSSDFDAEKIYELSISKGLKGTIGGVLKEDYSTSLGFGQLESDIKFANSKAVYLSKKGGGNVEVRITNTPKVKLIISKIYENNLLMAERNGYYPASGDGENYDEEYYSDIVLGDVIYSKEIDTRSLPKVGNGRLLNISQFEDRLPDVKGVYHVMIRSSEDYWVSDSRFISFSDIGLIARQGDEKIIVFANSIKTTEAIGGLTINVYGANNQLLGTAPTNGNGVAEVSLVQRTLKGFKPALIIAKSADDFTYLPFSSTRVNTSRFDVGGKKNNPSNFDTYIYAERDIYRPGETMNFSVLIRDGDWKNPGEIPIKLKFLMPNGKEFKTFRKSLNEQGAMESSIDLPGSAITGSYILEVYSSNDVMLASKSFMVEEFVPDRIRIDAKLDKASVSPGQTINLSINAMNFFGPPAANRNYETEIQVRQKVFAPKNFRDYDFTLANQKDFFDKDVREGKTDENGNASISFEADAMYKDKGLLQVGFYTTVFDETGRPVSRHTTAEIFTQEIFHGIKSDDSYYYPLNRSVAFQLISLNRNFSPVNATAHVKVIKKEYKTVLAKAGRYFRYDSQMEEKVITQRDMAVGAATNYSFIPRSPGDYELRVYRPGSNTYVSKRFYSYGSWGGENSSFEVNTEGNIDIETDKEGYQAGEMAKLLFKTPFSGKLLVTLETDHVISYQYLDVEKRSATMEVKLDKIHLPNVYVTATLIKPHDISDIPLTVAHGFKNLKVEDSKRKIAVQITAQKNVRSKTKQKVRVKAMPGSYVTLAAVDNGILQVSSYKTPDPYAFFYQKKALQVNSFDIYPLLFPELRNRSSTGGDGDIDMSKRVNPMPAKRFKLMSYWSGMKKADGNGNADFEFDIPQFSGEIRLMAVAYKDENFGSAETTTTVADPVVISSALPRFISPGDTVLMPVTITNTTGKPASAKANIVVKGPVKVLGNNNQSIQVKPNSEERAIFQLVADRNVNMANITVNVQALGEKFTEETEISVRPPSTLQKLSGSGSIVGGSNQTIQLPQKSFIEGSYKYELVVSKSPIGELGPHLRYLLQYPYGCTEQTISSAFPQLYFSSFANLLGGSESRRQVANSNVMEAIRRIKMRQLYNGAVTLWDGMGSEDWWTTVYAAHFLIEARKAGFDVDESLTETMLAYLANKLRTKETIIYYYNRSQQKKIAPKEVAYSLYVLALAGRSQVSSMNYYKSNQQLLALDGKYLLSAAFAISGDKRSFVSMLPGNFSGEESVQQTGGSFYSPLRDEAIALNALIEADPGNKQIPVMAKHVSDRLKSERYLNTQERAFSFLSLGKLAKQAASSNISAEVRAGGKTIKLDGDFKGNNQTLGNGPVEIRTNGNGRLYYSWVAEGISTTGEYVEEDNFIKVRRQFFDRNGRKISNNNFKQNDLVIVELTLEKAYQGTIENIVITDLLPAGFEIENPRTKELPGMEWIKNESEPVALDIRDDRIHFFVNAAATVQKYYYAVRVVSTGSFRQGPVSADAMYNGEIHSYHGAQLIKVRSQ